MRSERRMREPKRESNIRSHSKIPESTALSGIFLIVGLTP